MEATHTIGTWTDGYHGTHRLKVTARIEPLHLGGETVETIEHQEVPRADVLRVAFTGETQVRAPGGRWREDGGGQNLIDLTRVTDFSVGWDAEKRDRLLTLWREWHLNDMQAGCAHQAVVGTTIDERLDRTEPCAKTGYRYGRKWLVRLVPDEVIAEITEMFGLEPEPQPEP